MGHHIEHHLSYSFSKLGLFVVGGQGEVFLGASGWLVIVDGGEKGLEH